MVASGCDVAAAEAILRRNGLGENQRIPIVKGVHKGGTTWRFPSVGDGELPMRWSAYLNDAENAQ